MTLLQRQTEGRKSGKSTKNGRDTKKIFKTSFDECQTITKGKGAFLYLVYLYRTYNICIKKATRRKL
jgi:hypothetical protein